jgi:hypothetical protein
VARILPVDPIPRRPCATFSPHIATISNLPLINSSPPLPSADDDERLVQARRSGDDVQGSVEHPDHDIADDIEVIDPPRTPYAHDRWETVAWSPDPHYGANYTAHRPAPILTRLSVSSPSQNSDFSTASTSSIASSHTLVFELLSEQDMEEGALAPKVEDMSEDYDESTASSRPSVHGTPTPSDPGPGTVKRGRGRPRKHPLPSSPGTDAKIAKGRSKTGCITCRRRKKKCDETKPQCKYRARCAKKSSDQSILQV